MLLITNEAVATKVFKKYKNCVAFSLAKNAKGLTDEDGKIIADYDTLGFLPDEDTINGIKNGDIKLKKFVKGIKKSITRPNMDDAGISLGVAQFLTMLTANRKLPVVMVIIEDEEDKARNKILVKYITEIIKLFGIKPIPAGKKVKKLFKGKRKKVASRVLAFNNGTKGCRLSKDGADLKKLLLCFYELELRQSGMNSVKDYDAAVKFFDSDETKACVKNLLRSFTATNLQFIADKKTCKRLAKKDKAAVDAYEELREILGTIDGAPDLPKAKYGQRKKKGKAIGAKMKTKKFVKYFEKKKHRPVLLLIYGHILARLLDFEVGTKEYNSHMKAVCEPFGSDFAKAYVAASNAFSKDNSKSE